MRAENKTFSSTENKTFSIPFHFTLIEFFAIVPIILAQNIHHDISIVGI